MKKILPLAMLLGMFAITNLTAHTHVIVEENYSPTIVVAQASPEVIVQEAPPEELIEDGGVCPGDGYIWDKGYWRWDGRWKWTKGHWEVRPRPGAVRVSGYWEHKHGHWKWKEAYWQ